MSLTSLTELLFTTRLHLLSNGVLSWRHRMLWWRNVLRRTIFAKKVPRYPFSHEISKCTWSQTKYYRGIWMRQTQLFLLLWRPCMSTTTIRINRELCGAKQGHWHVLQRNRNLPARFNIERKAENVGNDNWYDRDYPNKTKILQPSNQKEP